ncbi:DUF922 domain-containing protein [Tamlana flava]|uniref:DUF922 domain-containing protein n=1 Tax=Tamlana flava TaxID=3158572 RepID=UPI00351B1453
MLKVILLFCGFLFFKQDEPVLSWSEVHRLSWADFKSKPNDNENAAAITASGITFGFSITQTDKNQVVSFTSEVHAHFYPEQSWYKVEQADDYALGHEQLHFYITELYARKFRERISELRVSNNIRKELKGIHENINKEPSEIQSAYDYETDYSRNYETQDKSSAFIRLELQKLATYKSIE